jgi:hypothetical protein
VAWRKPWPRRKSSKQLPAPDFGEAEVMSAFQ